MRLSTFGGLRRDREQYLWRYTVLEFRVLSEVCNLLQYCVRMECVCGTPTTHMVRNTKTLHDKERLVWFGSSNDDLRPLPSSLRSSKILGHHCLLLSLPRPTSWQVQFFNEYFEMSSSQYSLAPTLCSGDISYQQTSSIVSRPDCFILKNLFSEITI
jgi:hypothetical protein